MSRIVLPGEPLVDGETALRPWRDSDLPALVAACQDPEISRWTRVPRPYGDSDARAYLTQRYDLGFTGQAAPFAVVDARTGTLTGSISLLRIAWEHQRAEVGYWLAAEARGRGHATRAVNLIRDWGVRTYGFERLDLLVATANLASQRVAQRAGFSREAVLRSYFRVRDERQDMIVYALLAGGADGG